MPMNDDAVDEIDLETHETKDVIDNHVNGSLTVIWRDWDKIINHDLKMIYISSINKGEIKGPHIHTKRNSYFACIHGKVVFIIKNNDGSYREIISSEEKPVLVYIPKNTSSAHINLSDTLSRVVALADLAWKPNDDEMKNDIFKNYNLLKWKNK
jgi:dTDP-4-dehydrorhamnose 3,5-epimerase|tara:strand:- start:1611 stop:2072 length:462 start_codon:yes stop_codon:yes gene_type:complete